MHRRISAIGAAAILAGVLTACSQTPAPVAAEDDPALVEQVDGSSSSRLTLTTRAAERLGIQTTAVKGVAGNASRRSVPYSAVFYGPDGETWVYVSPKALTYIREPVVIDRIDGQVAVLTEGPAVDAQVVTVGVAELYGTEFEVGH